eukprot:GEMP01074594.1.p1 GENE.GEMP01074594.1~~GEMP01074594.1.p1  ORF type:complete len:236 (+),score=53.65 GEMP01074594.1:92-709(+)
MELTLDTLATVLLVFVVAFIFYLAQENEKRNKKYDEAKRIPSPCETEVDELTSSCEDVPSDECQRDLRVERASSIRDDVMRIRKRGERDELARTYEIGEKLILPVEDIHFTLPRCKIKGETPTMAEMMKWRPEQFAEEGFSCARTHFGAFACWAADGSKANRMLYVMKKRKVETLLITVTPAPKSHDDEYAETCGTDFQKIQLIP